MLLMAEHKHDFMLAHYKEVVHFWMSSGIIVERLVQM